MQATGPVLTDALYVGIQQVEMDFSQFGEQLEKQPRMYQGHAIHNRCTVDILKLNRRGSMICGKSVEALEIFIDFGVKVALLLEAQRVVN